MPKKLMTGELRFVAKQFRAKLWGVYDKARASWPGQTAELGPVRQELSSKEEAQAEADRLNGLDLGQGGQVEAGKKPAARKSSAEKKTAPREAPVEVQQLPDYGEAMTDEEREKYEKGLFEEVKY